LRAILFDVDGVVVHGFHADPLKRRRWDEHIQSDLGIDPQVLSEQFFKGTFTLDVISGRRPLLDALDEFLPTVGYAKSSMSFVSYWLSRDSQLNLPLLDTVRKLRLSGGARLFLATNQEHLRAFHLWSTLGLQHIFDDILYSARLGACKPDPEFFQHASEKIGPGAGPPLLFDDSQRVVDAARTFGWEAVLYDSLDDCARHPWIAARLA
jgi:putative hydrolase of the HAD superfamily